MSQREFAFLTSLLGCERCGLGKIGTNATGGPNELDDHLDAFVPLARSTRPSRRVFGTYIEQNVAEDRSAGSSLSVLDEGSLMIG
jgi:hypothetical protein